MKNRRRRKRQMRPRLCQLLFTATDKQKPEHSVAVMLGHVRCRRGWSCLPWLFFLRVAQCMKSTSKGREKHLGNTLLFYISSVKAHHGGHQSFWLWRLGTFLQIWPDSSQSRKLTSICLKIALRWFLNTIHLLHSYLTHLMAVILCSSSRCLKGWQESSPSIWGICHHGHHSQPQDATCPVRPSKTWATAQRCSFVIRKHWAPLQHILEWQRALEARKYEGLLCWHHLSRTGQQVHSTVSISYSSSFH